MTLLFNDPYNSDSNCDEIFNVIKKEKTGFIKYEPPKHYCGIPPPEPTKRKTKTCGASLRLAELATPKLLKIETTLECYQNTLEPKRIVRLVKLAHELQNPQPKRRIWRRKKQRPCKKPKRCRKEALNQWLNKQAETTSLLILRYFDTLQAHRLNYKQVLVTHQILKHMNMKCRKDLSKETRQEICKITQKLALEFDVKLQPYKQSIKTESVKRTSVATLDQKHVLFSMRKFFDDYESEYSSSEEEEEGEEGMKKLLGEKESVPSSEFETILEEGFMKEEGEGFYDHDVTIEEEIKIELEREGQWGEEIEGGWGEEYVGEDEGLTLEGALRQDLERTLKGSKEFREGVTGLIEGGGEGKEEEEDEEGMGIVGDEGKAFGDKGVEGADLLEGGVMVTGLHPIREEGEGESTLKEVLISVEEEEEETLGIAGEVSEESEGEVELPCTHPEGTASYVSWCLYESWLNEFSKNIFKYGGCLKKFRNAVEIDGASKHTDVITTILKNWSDYLGDVRKVDKKMGNYFRNKPITKCKDCKDCKFYDLYNIPKDHDIPEELVQAVKTTILWKNLLAEAEKLCDELAEIKEEVLSLASEESLEILEVVSSKSSCFEVEDLRKDQ